jgi:hypothetical protein
MPPIADAARSSKLVGLVTHPLVIFPLATGGLVAGVVLRSPGLLWLTIGVVAGYSLSGSV